MERSKHPFPFSGNQVDPAMLLLLETSGAVASIDIDRDHYIHGRTDDFFQFLGFFPAEAGDVALTKWVHIDDQDQFSAFLARTWETNSPQVSAIRFSLPQQKYFAKTCHLLAIPTHKLLDQQMFLKEKNDKTLRIFVLTQLPTVDFNPTLLHDHKLFNLGALSAGVAHDLNNIFSSLLSFTEILQTKLDDPKLLQYTQHIKQTIGRATDLTNGITTFLRDDKEDDLIAETINIDPIKCLRDVSMMVQPSLGKRVQYKLEPPSVSYSISIKRAHLNQILLNLIVNARDAIGENKGTINVRAYYEPSDDPDIFVLEVEDSGYGIPPERTDRIFEPFFTTKSDQNGTGLGLTIVKTLVDDAYGEIEVDSVPGETVFRIVLPVVKNTTSKDP